MGWSFRKSKSFGSFRLNLSKSGLGVSFGVKGARISVNKRGTYVNLGANGIYYRQKINGKNNSSNNFTPRTNEPSPVVSDPLHTITTQDVDNVTDVDSRAFIDELESKASRGSLFKLLGLWPSIVLFIYALSFANDVIREEVSYKDVFTINKKSVHVRAEPTKESQSIAKAKFSDPFTIAAIDSTGWIKIYLNGRPTTGFVRADMGHISRIEDYSMKITRMEEQPFLKYAYTLLAIALIGWCIYLRSVDIKRKTLEIYYTLDHEVAQLHEKFLQYFGEFAASVKIWQNLHVTGVHDAKYHAGASQLVSRIGVGGVWLHKLPSSFLKTNVSIPCITLRNTELYFFPERLIVKRGNTFGAVFYKNITIEKSDVKFIESEPVPTDALVVDYTWEYLNKSGGPDRRFNDNRQLPVCHYTEYTFQSDSGLFEVITTSKAGALDNFRNFVKAIGNFQTQLN